MTDTIQLEGRFDRVIWQSRDSGDFKVCSFLRSDTRDEQDAEVVVKGHIPTRLQHCDVVIDVRKVHSERYGQQYQYVALQELSLPTTLRGFINYMHQNHGVTATNAHKLYSQLSPGSPYDKLDAYLRALCKHTGAPHAMDALARLAKDKRLASVLKQLAPRLFIDTLFGVQKVFRLLASWAKLKQGEHLEAWLFQLGLTGLEVERIVQHYAPLQQSATVLRAMLTADPYRLCSEVGLPFHNVDVLACRQIFKKALPLTDARRIRAAVTHVLQHTCFLDGHLCLPFNALGKRVFATLRQCRHVAESVTDGALSDAICTEVETMASQRTQLLTLLADPFKRYGHASAPSAKKQTPYSALCDILTLSPTSKHSPITVKRHEHQGKSTLYVYHTIMWMRECAMARVLKTLLGVKGVHRAPNPSGGGSLATVFQHDHGFAPDTSQLEALRAMIEKPIVLLRGGAGTGKTTVLRTLVTLCKASDIPCTLAAPTGVAAKRLEERTKHNAHTLHSLVARWSALVHDDAERHVFVVDEMSMVDVVIFWSFLKQLAATPSRIKLILVGDPQQLPPVGPGSVYVSLLASHALHTSTLKQVHRQQEGGIIDTASRMIRAEHYVKELQGATHRYPYFNACMPKRRHTAELALFTDRDNSHVNAVGAPLQRQFVETLFQILAGGLVRVGQPRDFATVQILCAVKQGPIGKYALNQRLQAVFNPARQAQPSLANGATQPERQWTFRVGDKVLYTFNDYVLGLRNGQQGFVTALDVQKKSITVDFALSTSRSDAQVSDTVVTLPKAKWMHYLEPSYAMTVHKSQGSEYETTFLLVPNASSENMKRFLDRRLLYTALTRAKRKCYLFGRREAIDYAIQNTQYRERYSLLKALFRRS